MKVLCFFCGKQKNDNYAYKTIHQRFELQNNISSN